MDVFFLHTVQIQGTEIGMWDYIQSVRESSDFYEKEYVNPTKVKMTFPKEKKNLIYDLMNGSLVLDEVKDLWKDQVVDEFAKGSYCSELYEEVYQAKVSLCNRLGVQEDSDIETVISNLLLIGKHLSMKMFDYGMEEERKQEKKHI